MSLRSRDVDRVFDKLRMKVRDGKDRHALFYHKGKLILRTKRSFGDRKIDSKIRHLIRQQLKLSETEFANVVGCTVNRTEYIKILRKKGLISVEPNFF